MRSATCTASVPGVAVDGRRAIAKSQKKTTQDLMNAEIRPRRSFASRRGLTPPLAVELAAIRLVLTERQAALKPCDGLPDLL